MARIFLIVFVVIGAISAAVLVVQRNSLDEPSGVTARLLPTGRTPAFHAFGTNQERERAMQQCLDQITSGAANALGSMKDDIALLCSDERMRRAVLDAWTSRAAISKYEAGAFADIFMLVRTAEFVVPGKEVFQHAEFEVRSKGPAVARTQRDPAFVPLLCAFYDELNQSHADQGTQTRLMVLDAAMACAGPEAPLVLERALGDSIATVRAEAADYVGRLGLLAFQPRLEQLLADEELGVRLRAGHALGRLGRAPKDGFFEQGLDARLMPELKAAMEAILDLHLSAYIPRLRRFRSEIPANLDGMVLTSLALLGDAETIAAARTSLADSKPASRERLQSLQVLAAAGTDADLAHVQKIVEQQRPGDAEAVVSGLAMRATTAPAGTLEALLNSTLSHPGQMAPVCRISGAMLLPLVAQQLSAADDSARAAFLIGILGAIGDNDARAAVLRAHDKFPDLCEQQLRLLDLEERKRG